jgi:phosphoribosylaminoimidazole-succinocarboxamide synthase
MATFSFPGQTKYYKGKVRDVYSLSISASGAGAGDGPSGTPAPPRGDLLVMIASNRISAFDVILPRPIPYKGQVLNQIAAFMLDATRDICPNWLLKVPAPNVSIGKRCVPFRVEMVVRGNLTGHAWRTYNSGERSLCGVPLPEGMKENDFFPTPIITPSTKAEEGHDEDISAEEIVVKGIVGEADYAQLEKYALALFARGKEIAASRGLILVDTKYEFGKIGDTVYLMDEVHTPDSSRYFYADGFEERQQKGERQQQLSKEFVREWLIENGFMGKEGQVIPEMTDAWVETISDRYIELYEKIIGAPFKKENLGEEEIYEATLKALQ